MSNSLPSDPAGSPSGDINRPRGIPKRLGVGFDERARKFVTVPRRALAMVVFCATEG
jgi:hypothetical protein